MKVSFTLFYCYRTNNVVRHPYVEGDIIRIITASENCTVVIIQYTQRYNTLYRIIITYKDDSVRDTHTRIDTRGYINTCILL